MQSRISLLRIAAFALLVYALALFTSSVRDVLYARQRLASQEAALCVIFVTSSVISPESVSSLSLPETGLSTRL